jgi:hypothetical protein
VHVRPWEAILAVLALKNILKIMGNIWDRSVVNPVVICLEGRLWFVI